MDKKFLVQLAHLYYVTGMTHQEIADKLHVSRSKVTRGLKEAREKNIVKISIDYSASNYEISQLLIDKYKIKEVLISGNESLIKDDKQIFSLAGQYLVNQFKENSTIAVGWGRTIRELSEITEIHDNLNLKFSPIIGGHGSTNNLIHSSTIAAEFAKNCRGISYSINGPALANNLDEKNIFIDNNDIASTISETKKADIALFSVGNPTSSESTIHKMNYFSSKELKEMINQNVICDFVSIAFFDINGQEKCNEISNRSIGLNIKDFQNIPLKICVAFGVPKNNSILAALRAGLIDVLITDFSTANFLTQD
ncbi:sugar-binding transcriptional regulator [Hutsoniella sourekii]|uniref:sugar-binding transcriptional regulator n=1 Tax=Hutsoniella sourekii TaxID=87650 RepID=UPI00047FE3C9|nr:sugar-binding domain-containing protein [Hutsoniella sourekii]